MAAAPPSARSADSGWDDAAAMASVMSRTWNAMRLDAGPRQLGAADAAGEAGDDAARLGIPPRAAQTGERGDEGDAAAVGDRRRQRADLGGRRDDAEPVAQPLDGRARDEGRALERVGHPAARVVGVVAEVPGAADREPVGRRRAVGPGVGQREAAGAVGDLHHARARSRPARRARPAGRRARPRPGRRRGPPTPGRGRPARRCRSGRPTGAPRAGCAAARRRGRTARGTRRAWPYRAGGCGWRWRGRWRRCRRGRRRSGSTAPRLSTVQKERFGSSGASARSPWRSSQAALVALK